MRCVRVAAEKCDGRHHGLRGHVKAKGGRNVAKVRYLEQASVNTGA